MVILKEHLPNWECPYCNDTFDTEDEAIDCAKDCCLDDMDTPTRSGDGDDEYICEYCDVTYTRSFKAEQCEENHIEKEDFYFHEKLKRESMLKLEEAAAHPSQIKLNKFSHS